MSQLIKQLNNLHLTDFPSPVYVSLCVITYTGHVINSGGIVVLGQDQDEYGGGFDQEQSFFGKMYGVNVWSSVRSSEEIYEMSKSCFHPEGDYLKWSHVKAAQYHGNVSMEPPTCGPRKQRVHL